MIGRRALVLAVGCAGCGSGQTPGTPSTPPPPTTLFVLTAPTLVLPQANDTINQNDPRTGCHFVQHSGRGFQVTFAWRGAQASAGIAGYDLEITPPRSPTPIFSQEVGLPPYLWRQCTLVVHDGELAGWQWRVRTLDPTGQHSDWSSPSTFNFAPCRLGATPCR